MADLSDRIEQLALRPKRMTVDGVSIEQPSIQEVVEAQKALDAQTASSRNHQGLRFQKIIPPGAG